jgi:hypothetical protein
VRLRSIWKGKLELADDTHAEVRIPDFCLPFQHTFPVYVQLQPLFTLLLFIANTYTTRCGLTGLSSHVTAGLTRQQLLQSVLCCSVLHMLSFPLLSICCLVPMHSSSLMCSFMASDAACLTVRPTGSQLWITGLEAQHCQHLCHKRTQAFRFR